jgi:hypothetical protein
MNNYILKLYAGNHLLNEQRSFSLKRLKRLCSAIQDKIFTHAEIQIEIGENIFYRYYKPFNTTHWRKIK